MELFSERWSPIAAIAGGARSTLSAACYHRNRGPALREELLAGGAVTGVAAEKKRGVLENLYIKVSDHNTLKRLKKYKKFIVSLKLMPCQGVCELIAFVCFWYSSVHVKTQLQPHIGTHKTFCTSYKSGFYALTNPVRLFSLHMEQTLCTLNRSDLFLRPGSKGTINDFGTVNQVCSRLLVCFV